jgi:hypothetical protein
MPITAIVAVASWHVIERRALDLKRRLGRAETPTTLGIASMSPVIATSATGEPNLARRS